MFVNGIAFLVSLSMRLDYTPVSMYLIKKIKQLSRSLRRKINSCARRGFKIRTLMMNMEFEKAKDQEEMELVDVNTAADGNI